MGGVDGYVGEGDVYVANAGSNTVTVISCVKNATSTVTFRRNTVGGARSL